MSNLFKSLKKILSNNSLTKFQQLLKVLKDSCLLKFLAKKLLKNINFS